MSSAPPSPNAFVLSNPFTSSPNPSSYAIALGNGLVPPSPSNAYPAAGPSTPGAGPGGNTLGTSQQHHQQLPQQTQLLQPPLAERADIHKACKTLESLLSVLNEYCEAASAVCALQKRMAKALRETAACKVTGEVAGNALQAAASIFEGLAEADSRFAKGADKEYDAISGEVKKWFKKLAKEEKTHDERMASANAKIKQAGQAYEKKSKRSFKGGDAASVTDEHARYIALISTLGPEIAQDKYNHALQITTRHTSTTLSVAGSLARIADGEWLRLCECVRRSAPTVGPLNQWRALCEGAWMGGVPVGLSPPPSSDVQPNPALGDNAGAGALKPIEEESTLAPATLAVTAAAQKPLASPALEAPPANANPPGYSTGPPSAAGSTQDLAGMAQQGQPQQAGGQQEVRQQQQQSGGQQAVSQQQQQQEPRQSSTSSSSSPVLSRNNAPLPTSDAAARTFDGDNDTNLFPPRPPFVHSQDGVDPNTGSVRSLSAFPAPPTHFPQALPQAVRQRSGLGLHTNVHAQAQADGINMAQADSATRLGVPASPSVSNSGERRRTPDGNNYETSRRLTESPRELSSDMEGSSRGVYMTRRDVERERERERETEMMEQRQWRDHENPDERDRELELQRELEEIQKRRNREALNSNVSMDQVRRPVPVKAHTSLPLDARAGHTPVSGMGGGGGGGGRHGGYSSVDLRGAGAGHGYRGDAYLDEGEVGEGDEGREFGVIGGGGGGGGGGSSDAMGQGRGGYNHASMRSPMAMERVDSGMTASSGTGSLVAAMRNRYSLNSGSLSPTPRDLPKLPLTQSVNDLAGRYEVNSGGDAVPLSPTPSPRARSPPVARQQSLPMLAAPGQQRNMTAQEVYQARRISGQGLGSSSQQQQQQPFPARTKDQELMERERELEARAQALERDRARLQNLRNGRGNDELPPPLTNRDRANSSVARGEDSSASNGGNGQFALRPRERRTSLRHPLQRPMSQMSGTGDEADLRQRYVHDGGIAASSSSSSPTKAAFSPKQQYRQALPRVDGPVYDNRQRGDRDRDRDRHEEQNARAISASASGSSQTGNTSSHASNCGCESCSISKYKTRPPATERQRVDSKPEKTRSWIRRLSMPGVGAAFHSDAKKVAANVNLNANGSSTTNYSLGSGVGHMAEKQGGRGLFSLKNSSTTGLRQSNDGADYRRTPGVPEDGQMLRGGAVAGRRSYDVGGGANNRSMTNLGISGRH